MCLPACTAGASCARGQLCSDGHCVQLAPSNIASSGCVAGAKLELSAPGSQLLARQGTLFGDALYLPVAYDAEPTDWVEPVSPAPILARVVTAQGEPNADCAVRFISGEGSGAAFADAELTDERGGVTAYWVAGARRDQTLTAALVDQRGDVVSQSIAGTAYANDAGPQATDVARTTLARPATLRLGYDLPDTVDSVRVVLSAASFPHHAFYSALNIAGFFAGLQNTGDFDLASAALPAESRVLIASVWNVPEGDAQLLFQADGVACGPHAQDLGGIRCALTDAWQPDTEYSFTLERTVLALDEAGQGYAALGYLTEACASSAGCTDYTLYFAANSDLMQRVVAYRYQSGERVSRFGSLVQPYLELPGQTSCLKSPRYDATFAPSWLVLGGFEPVPSATFSAAYLSWHNEVCANYAGSAEPNGFRLISGGPQALARPELPDDPARTLTLP